MKRIWYIPMKEIAPKIYVEDGYTPVTVGAVLTEEGWLCIDTPTYPRDALAWRSELAAISPKPVLYIVVTDHHRDRILGNSFFDAPVVAHQSTAEYILSLKDDFTLQVAEELSTNSNELIEIASVRLAIPQISYTDSLYLICGEREISLLHKPSATLGNTWVLLPEEQVCFVGDTVICDRHPYISEGASGTWLGTLRDLRRGRLAHLTLVPGRGPVTDTSATEVLSEYLRFARRRVKSLITAKRPRADVGSLAPEFLDFFPYRASRREEVLRRIKVGLEAIYDEYLGDGGGRET